MRRNTLRIFKYVIFAVIFMIIGPGMVRFLLESESQRDSVTDAQESPESSEEKRRHQSSMLAHKNPKHAMHLKVQNVNGGTGHKLWEVGMDMSGVPQIDFHDYQLAAQEEQRTGPGEQGSAVILNSDEEKQKYALYRVNGFNALASDKIALDRAIKDIRHPQCKQKKYLEILPNVSIVIPFHNEHWTTLLRTVVSVINRSPKHLLHEVILVDDFSNKEFLKKKLDDHVATNYDGKVKVIHADKREGLIRTRLLGARHATGQVLIFLDSHVEANTNWLPPLLEPIARDYKTVVCPFIDVIDAETFAYRAQDEGSRGAFDWELYYKRLPLLPEDLEHPAEPFKSPVMAGGLFAISTKWFWELGGYDPGLDIWGGEQFELSFKLWQCGGEMVDAPCSRVGHIYRKFAPYPNPGVGNFLARNYRRVAEVWMDEYAEYLYKRKPYLLKIDTGDISEQVAIRNKLNCKPFKWFMEEVAFDLPKHYPPIEPPSFAEGELRSDAANLCVDTRYHGENEKFGMERCAKDTRGGGQQQFELSWYKDIRVKKSDMCFDVSAFKRKVPVILYYCHGMGGNQHFKYNVNTKQIFHPMTHHCLDCNPATKEIYMDPCNVNALSQKWTWEHVNVTLVQQEWDS